MAKPIIVPMTPGLTASGNYIVRLTALDPTTGAVVSGVNITGGAILAIDLSPSPVANLSSGPFTLIPAAT